MAPRGGGWRRGNGRRDGKGLKRWRRGVKKAEGGERALIVIFHAAGNGGH